MNEALPVAELSVDGNRRTVLVDSGCSRCIVYAPCCRSWERCSVRVKTVSGQEMRCVGTGTIVLAVAGVGEVAVAAIVVDVRPLGFDVIMGMNGISALGGVTIAEGAVRFGLRHQVACAGATSDGRAENGGTVSELRVDEKDFCAVFDPAHCYWTVEWKWADGIEPGVLTNGVSEYAVARDVRDGFESELEQWIRDGWLVPYDEAELGRPRGLIPLMAVVQASKSKVRPVLDYRELNEHIETHTAEADVCAVKLREWRKQGLNISAVDLKNAYLQIRVGKSLWPFQTVVFRGRRYCLTRLGLGLNIGPSVMKAVLGTVLAADSDVKKGTSSYVDDILVNEDDVSAARVRDHLSRHGLVAKEPQRVSDGARLLGLKVWGERGRGMLRWKRDNEYGAVPDKLTRRSVFSLCGKLIGHYPVCGWLRVAVSYLKRVANEASEGWDDVIIGGRLREMLTEVVERVKRNDPVGGRWDVNGNKARVWVDASSLATGVLLEVDGATIEDASWLRSNASSHINMAELDAVIKGLNVALAWDLKSVELMTDSSTVHRWITDGLTGKRRLKTKASSEMLIRRRIDIVTSLVGEYGMQVTVRLVPSAENKADALTRVPQRWLHAGHESSEVNASPCALAVRIGRDAVAEIHHSCGHPGVKRTLHFARRVDPSVTRADVKSVIAGCDVCQSIDPAPVKWPPGKLDVDTVWQRVAMDVTHFRGRAYLSLIDCGPSRFAVWRPLRLQTSAAIIEQLELVFCERGAPEELLTDNDPAFRSRQFQAFSEQWNLQVRFRCAHRPQGNGIAERCHRTVKVIAARKNCTVAEAVYWHNVSPPSDGTSESTPADQLYRYRVRVRGVDTDTRISDDGVCCDSSESGPYRAGDSVWVRPPDVRCDQRFAEGTVTDVLSEQAVVVDGVPRHVRDIRRRARQRSTEQSAPVTDTEEPLVVGFSPEHGRQPGGVPPPPDPPQAAREEMARDHTGRPVRARRPPGYLADYETA